MAPPRSRIAILDVSGRDRSKAPSSPLVSRLEADGFEVEDALGWPEDEILDRLDGVRSLLVICGPGVQSFLDESLWLRGMLEYTRRTDPSLGSKLVPMLLGDDPEVFVPAFLAGGRLARYPSAYDELVVSLQRGAPSPRVTKKDSSSKRKALQPQATPEPTESPEPEPPLKAEPPPGTRRVEIVRDFASGSLRKAQDEFSAHFDRDEGGLALEQSSIEGHVVSALQAAHALAGKGSIDARTLLRGISYMRFERTSSSAFAQLAALLPRTASFKFPLGPNALERPLSTLLLDAPLARSLEIGTSGRASDGKLWGRDLVAIALLTRGDPSLHRFAEEAGISVPELQDRWYAFVTSDDVHRSQGEWQRWWRAAGIPRPSERGVRAGVFAESVQGEDHLGIEADVAAFARLIADAQTNPPLSIGLIGDWGSGKSFFMEQVLHRVAALKGSGPGVCHEVAQIRFSAWHYSDTNIWASLVGHIFDEVWEQMCPEVDDDRARTEVREQLKEAHGALFEAESEMERAREVLEAAQFEEHQAQGTLAVRHFVSERATHVLHDLASKVGWSGSLGSIVELEEARDSLRVQAMCTRSVLETALRGPALRSALLWIGVVTVATAGLVLLVGWLWPQDWVQSTVRVFAAVGGVFASLVAAIAAPLTKARNLLQKLTQSVDDTIGDYERQVEAAKQTEEGQALVDRIERARSELIRIRARADAARQRLVELERRQASLSPARRLTAFLETRAGADDYRSKQGIISLVRRDFDQLSTLMKRWRKDGGAPPEGVRPVDRIVLYIDDLDRCSPGLVVRTLEAIHLLLALDLFVVVVAVDSRWLLRALAVHYEDLLGAREDDDEYRVSTPQSYLEKIFQITFAVAPMTEEGFGSYVDFLAGHEEGPPPGFVEPSPVEVGVETEVVATAGAKPADQPRTEQQSQETEGSADSEVDEEDVTRARSVIEAERQFLRKLHGMVGTPRLVKRLVNVFRLIKSRVPPGTLSEFEAEGTGRHRPILLLLAILYGRPELSLELFRALSEGTLRSPDDDPPFHDALRRRGDEGLARWVEAVAPTVTVADCEAEAYPLARYSLVTGQHWHTWRRTPAA